MYFYDKDLMKAEYRMTWYQFRYEEVLMKHLFLLLVALMIGCGGAGAKTPTNSPSGLHRHIGESTVALLDNNGPGEFRVYCTGVWVSEVEIATAAHCVAHDEEDAEGLDPVGKQIFYTVNKEVHEVGEVPAGVHLAEVVAFDEEHDVALVKADKRGVPAHEVAELASLLPGVGEHVFVVGHRKGMYWSFAEGTVSSYRDESSIGKVVQVNATVWFGNSGGGVFDNNGKLVGICSRLTKVPQMNLYVHLDYLKALLKDYHTPSPLPGLVPSVEKK